MLLGSMLLVIPEVFGVGYGAINNALMNKMSLALMGALIFGKILATSVSLGSGRITSYNVCYTKLLRLNVASGNTFLDEDFHEMVDRLSRVEDIVD